MTFQPDAENVHDPYAMALLDEAGNRLGYINTCHARSASSWLSNGSISARVFRINGRANYPRLFVIADNQPTLARQIA